jgi:hypothetical protein
MGKEPEAKPTWLPMWLRHSWVRDWLCPACVYGSLLLFWQPWMWWQWLILMICYPILGGALSTYWDFMFGYDNFYWAGFMCGVAAFPLFFCNISLWSILIRAFVIGIAWGFYCSHEDVDYKEEFFRGFLLVITIPLLLI